MLLISKVQSFGRDLGSPNETDYAVLQQVKQQTRETIISWILEDVVEPTEEPTTDDPEETVVPAEY